MNLLGWISLVFNALLAVALLVIRYNFDKKLEILRADLRAKDAQINLLQSGAISALASRQSELYKRRIEAVDQLWSAVVDLTPAKTASALLGTFKLKKLLDLLKKNPNLKKLFIPFEISARINKIDISYVLKVRPFVSETAWAMFSAYQAIAFFVVFQLEMIRLDLNEVKILDEFKIDDLIEAVLPCQSEDLKKLHSVGYHSLLEELESRLLKELQNILKGEESDKHNIEQTAKIIKEATRVMQKISDKTVEEQLTPGQGVQKK